jgi:protein-tyrosine phosphatase
VTWDLPANTAARIAAGVAELRGADLGLNVCAGAEVAITRGLELPDEELRGLRLGGGEWLLCECPLTSAGAGIEMALLHLQSRGHRIILAHPERSPTMQRDPALLGRLVGAGMLGQVTVGSLRGQFGQTVRRFALELFEQGLVHNVASDAHDAVRRPPGVRHDLLELERELPGMGDQVSWLLEAVPDAVLGGGSVPPRPGPPPRRRGRGRRWLSRR